MKAITLALGSAGVLIILGATIRWSYVYFDLSQLVLASIIGLMFIGFGFFFERLDGIYGELVKIRDMRKEIKEEIIKELS